VAAVLAGALAMVLLLGPTRQDAYQIWRPEGYVQQVEEWIRDGRLLYDCTTRRIEAAADLGPAERTFYSFSYLADDVETWNDGDQRPFLVEHEELRRGGCDGRLAGVNDSFHNQRLPGYVAETWEGSLYLRPTRGSTALISGRRTLEVLPVAWERLPLSSEAFEDAVLSGEDGVRSSHLALTLPPSRRAFATLELVGDEAVLERLEDNPEVFLDSCPIPLGWRLRLEAGDVVRTRDRDGRLDERFQVETGERAGLVSFLTRVNGEARRRSFTDRLSSVREIAWAVDSVVDSARDVPTHRDDFDVHLTLDPVLNDRLDRAVADFAARYGSRLPRVAATVLDADSGRLLALASYPDAGALKRFGVDEGSTRWALLHRNQNFMMHPVGSATKPFLTAAALATEPRLASLRVPCTPDAEPETMLGYDMGRFNLEGDCQGGDGDGTIDLESFLEVSSNRYMLYLGLLAMADWEGGGPESAPGGIELPPEERYLISGRSFRTRPYLPMVRYDDDRPGDGTTPLQEVTRQSRLSNRFEALFDQGAEYRREGTVEALDLGLWQPAIRAAFGTPGDEPAPRTDAAVAFSPVTPEQVNLRLNLAQQLRQDLYTVLLGNGNNRWSNVQMAEALARLVRGHRVEAQLLERVSVPAERQTGTDAPPRDEVLWERADQPPPEPLGGGLDERLRGRILEGMRRVVHSGRGTASELGLVLDRINERAPDGVVYDALGKTGTPSLPLSVVRRSPVTEAPGAIRNYSGTDFVQSGMLVLAVERRQGGESEHLALALFVDSQGNSAQAVALAAALLPSLVETYWPEDWLGGQ
jgi:cell division protein FtsI/penicillin-binding protein 2